MNDDPRVGTILAERYRVDALIGEGGMGKVYAAEHVLMKKRLAVKVLHRELTALPEVVQRFEREAQAAANVDHPNVAAATDFGKLADGSVFLVLEFVQGRSLRDEMAPGPMPAARAMHIARQIAAGLGSAHALGIVHRDLKPENVMLVERGADADFVKVLDFGIAKVPIGEMPSAGGNAARPITKAGMVFGTPEYMSPEQALGQVVDGRSDLYGLGVILFEMLAGGRPFPSDNPVGILGQQLSNPPPRVSSRIPCAPALDEIVQRLLARDRDQRFSNAVEVVAVLDAVLAGVEPVLPVLPPPATERMESRPRAASAPSSGPPAGRPAQTVELGAWRRSVPRPLRLLASSGALVAAGLGLLGLGRLLFGTGGPLEGSAASSAPARAVAGAGPAERVGTSVAPEQRGPAVPPPSASSAAAGRARAELEQAQRSLAKREYAAAVAAVDKALALEPGVAADEVVAEVLWRAAQAPESATAAFGLLTSSMRGRGAELLWDLAEAKDTRPAARRRAGQWLRSTDFRRVAPPALVLAADLRTAKTCGEAHELLPAAREIGDDRSLAQLEAWTRRTGCGKGEEEDCMPCLRADDRLDDALLAIRQRGKRVANARVRAWLQDRAGAADAGAGRPP